MSKPRCLSFAFGCAVVVTASVMLGLNSADSQEQPVAPKDQGKRAVPAPEKDLALNAFMRKKLEASSQILEGLTAEDAQLIIKGAKALVEMSAAEKWQVRNDVMYRQFSGEFQRSAKGLLESAEKGNFDGAALKWTDTMLKCLECHKFVRGIRLATQK